MWTYTHSLTGALLGGWGRWDGLLTLRHLTVSKDGVTLGRRHFFLWDDVQEFTSTVIPVKQGRPMVQIQLVPRHGRTLCVPIDVTGTARQEIKDLFWPFGRSIKNASLEAALRAHVLNRIFGLGAYSVGAVGDPPPDAPPVSNRRWSD
jgi:hypothetical protein